jgi:hypothetical protein
LIDIALQYISSKGHDFYDLEIIGRQASKGIRDPPEETCYATTLDQNNYLNILAEDKDVPSRRGQTSGAEEQ